MPIKNVGIRKKSLSNAYIFYGFCPIPILKQIMLVLGLANLQTFLDYL